LEKAKSPPAFKGSEFIRLAAGESHDILSVVLEPDGLYTEAQVEQRIEKFVGKKVK
jgi:hypothetical protein